MGNLLIHNFNNTQTHLELESGEFIELKETPEKKPPVNDKLYNFSLKGKTVQDGEPTPDNPVPIQSVPSEFDITSCGVNLLNVITPTRTYGGVTFKFENNIVELSGTATVNTDAFLTITPLTLRKGQVYTFKCFELDNPNNANWDNMSLFDTFGYRPFRITRAVLQQNAEMTQDFNARSIHFFVVAGVNHTGIKFKWELEKGSRNITVYTPYNGTTTPFQIRDIDNNPYELCSLESGESDKIVDGKLIKELFEYVVDHTTATGKSIDVVISLSNDTYTYFNKAETAIFGTYPNGLLKNGAIPLCDKFAFLPGQSAQQEGVRISNGAPPCIQVKILNSRAGILSADDSTARRTKIITWLESNPLTVQLAWLTPNVYDLHPDELEKLNSIKSVQYHTNIFTSASVPPTMSFLARKLGNKPKELQNFYLLNGEQLLLSNAEPLEIYL